MDTAGKGVRSIFRGFILGAVFCSALVIASAFAQQPPPASPPPAEPAKSPVATPPVIPVANISGIPEPTPGGDYLHVVGTVPLEGDILSDRLVVFFDKPIAPLKNPAGLDQALFKATPPLPLNYERREGMYLAYRINFSGAKPSPYYEIELSPDLKSKEGKPIDPAQRRLLFTAYKFEIENLWLQDVTADALILNLAFPIPVDLASLKSHMRIGVPNAPDVPYSCTPSPAGNIFAIAIPIGTDKNAGIQLKPGLLDKSGRACLLGRQNYVIPRPEPMRVTITWEQSSNGNAVKIITSSAVKRDDLKTRLTVVNLDDNQPIKFDVVGDDAFHYANLAVGEKIPSKISVVLTKGLKSAVGTFLEADIKETLEYRPSSQIVNPINAQTGEQSTAKRSLVAFEHNWWNRGWGDRARTKGLSLNVNLNHPVPIDQIRKFLSIEPAIENMSLEPSHSNMFEINGDWDSKRAYRIKLGTGLVDANGATLDHDIFLDVKSEEVPAYADLSRNEYYFPRRPGMSLPLDTRNIDKTTITLHRMFPSNIAVAVNEIRDGKPEYNFTGSYAEQIGSMSLDVGYKADRLISTPIQLDSLFPIDKKGVFCVAVTGTRSRQNGGGGSQGQPRLVLWTDIGVLAHWQNDEASFFVHDLFTLQPLSPAKVTLYSSKNQEMGYANTDENGIVQLRNLPRNLGSPRVAVVEYKDDYTFIDLQARDEGTPEEKEVSEMPRFNSKGYDAFIYADRDLYRPGETIHAHWMVRALNGEAIGGIPLLFNVRKPNGANLLTQPTMLTAVGSGGFDLPTEKTYPTGKYTITLKVPGTNTQIGTYEFSLEEFVPNRMKATVTVDDPRLHAGKDYLLHLNAQHLFGAPAIGRKADAVVVLKRGDVTMEGWKEYRFENDSNYVPEPAPCGEQTTDDAGNATFTFNYTPNPRASFPMKAILVGSVYELGGRTVRGKAEATVFPSDVCLGITTARPTSGKGIEVFAAAVTPEQTPATLDKVNITLEKRIWNYNVRRYDSGMTPRWSETFEMIETREVPLNGGKGSTVFTPADYGYYRVRVHSAATPQYSTRLFYYYGSDCMPMESARPSLLKITLDKPVYQIGDEAQIRIECPFDGRAIVVVQGEHIQQMLPVEIKDKVGTLKLSVGKDQVPNVWLAVTAVHAVPKERQQVYPFSSFAMADLCVRNPQRQLNVAFPNLPTEVKPAGDVAFDVQVTDTASKPVEAEVTLAAVDEGIHGISDYQNPDPIGWLFRPRWAEVSYNHYYDKVAYDFYQSPIGGDMLLRDLAKRLPSADENWIKPLALWSGVVKTDAAGNAKVTFTLPEFAGQLRLVAVACTPSALGAQAGNIYVRRAHMLRTSMPRFLLPGDQAKVRANLFNNTDTACKAKVSWTLEGGGAGAGASEVDVPAHGEASCFADIQAGGTIGKRTLKWEAVFLDAAGAELERIPEIAPLPVRAPASYETKFEVTALKAGETREFKNTAFLADEKAELELMVGATPLLRMRDGLKYLIHYPYGCVEQTTSALMPTYLMRQTPGILAGEFKDGKNLDLYINAGISRLFSMQTVHGGFAMWPGEQMVWDYGTVYALHFLTLVENGRQFALPEQNMIALREYVRKIALGNGSKGCNDFTRAYAIYDLVLAGETQAVDQIARFDTIPLPRSTRYLLAAALAYATKDSARVENYLKTMPSQLDYQGSSLSLDSDIRNTAVQLLSLTQAGLHPEQAAEFSQKIITYLSESRRYYTTQDLAFVVAALSSYLNSATANIDAATATITGKGVQEALTGKEIKRATQNGGDAALTVVNTGPTDMYVAITTGGVPATPVQTAASEGGLNITRSLKTTKGDPYTESTFTQGGSYVVDVTIKTEGDLENVAVADLLPGGFEVENPRLSPDTLPSAAFENGVAVPGTVKKAVFKQNNESSEGDEGEGEGEGEESDYNATDNTNDKRVTASYLDVRDDRVLLAFKKLPAGEHHFYYVIRAVTPGHYQYPGVQAECMYDARIRAKALPGQIDVKGN